MLLVVTSSGDSELALFTSRPTIAVVVPAHLSQSGWFYQVGEGALARLMTSRGDIGGSELSGVLTRIHRVLPGDLPHIEADDREYVAAEMTAFLAALISEMACPLLNRPAANSLWGPPWTIETWWRAAAKEGFPVCCNYDKLCTDLASIVVLGRDTIHRDNTLPDYARALSESLAACAGVSLLEARFCKTHQALQQVSLRPKLTGDLVAKIEEHCALGQRLS
jgi:hypothetical protein